MKKLIFLTICKWSDGHVDIRVRETLAESRAEELYLVGCSMMMPDMDLVVLYTIRKFVETAAFDLDVATDKLENEYMKFLEGFKHTPLEKYKLKNRM